MQQTDFAVRKRATVLSGASDSDVVDFRRYSFGTLQWPAALTSATVSFYVCTTADGTFTQLVDDSGTAISITFVASKSTPLPVELAGAMYFKFHTASAEGADRSLVFACKP